MDAFFAIVCLTIGVLFYFLPCFVAGSRHHPHGGGIFVVNFFLGWTLLGWIVALAWALSGGSHDAPAAPIASPATKDCPYCAETILTAAIVCKHCGRDLPAPLAEAPAQLDWDAKFPR